MAFRVKPGRDEVAEEGPQSRRRRAALDRAGGPVEGVGTTDQGRWVRPLWDQVGFQRITTGNGEIMSG